MRNFSENAFDKECQGFLLRGPIYLNESQRKNNGQEEKGKQTTVHLFLLVVAFSLTLTRCL